MPSLPPTSPPAPPPMPPSPPPPLPPLSPGARYEQYGIRFAVTVAGDVETFDAAEFRLRLAVALDGAVEPATIEVEAGSVRVVVTLWTADEASAEALLDKLRVVMATADAASTALELPVAAIAMPPHAAYVQVDAPSPPPPTPPPPTPPGVESRSSLNVENLTLATTAICKPKWVHSPVPLQQPAPPVHWTSTKRSTRP